MAHFDCVVVADNCCDTNRLLTGVSHTSNLSALDTDTRIANASSTTWNAGSRIQQLSLYTGFLYCTSKLTFVICSNYSNHINPSYRVSSIQLLKNNNDVCICFTPGIRIGIRKEKMVSEQLYNVFRSTPSFPPLRNIYIFMFFVYPFCL